MKEQDIYFIRGTLNSVKQDLYEVKKLVLADDDHDMDQKIHMIGRIVELEQKVDRVNDSLTRVKRQPSTPSLQKVEQS